VKDITRILAGRVNGALWLRVDGRGSQQVSPHLRAFVARNIDAGTSHLVVDLACCPAMDSTFMGTLAALAARLTAQPGGRLEVVHPNERNLASLENLGLNQIFEVHRDEPEVIGSAAPSPVEAWAEIGGQETPDRELRRACMLEAHEALSEVHAPNAPRFHEVIECLRRGGTGGPPAATTPQHR
jgi:anti-anti-sigma regulatory factor